MGSSIPGLNDAKSHCISVLTDTDICRYLNMFNSKPIPFWSSGLIGVMKMLNIQIRESVFNSAVVITHPKNRNIKRNGFCYLLFSFADREEPI